MRLTLAAALVAVAACSGALYGPRNIPEAARGVYTFDVLMPDASTRNRIKGSYTVRADTVVLDLEGDSFCRPVRPHPAEVSIRYDCGMVGASWLFFSFDPRRPHRDAWAVLTEPDAEPRRECVSFDRSGQCSQWVTEYGDMTRTERVRLNAKRVT